MTPATRGSWWRSESGGLYLVLGIGFSDHGAAAVVRALWITGHKTPQLHRVKLAVFAWRAITAKGERLTAAPTVNQHGDDVREQVAEALRRLEDDPG